MVSLVHRHDGLAGVVFPVCLARVVVAGGVDRPRDVCAVGAFADDDENVVQLTPAVVEAVTSTSRPRRRRSRSGGGRPARPRARSGLCWTQNGFRSQGFSGWVSFGGVCQQRQEVTGKYIHKKEIISCDVFHIRRPDGKLDVSDRGRAPFRASLRGCPTRDGEQTPKVSKPTTTGGGDDDGVGGHRAARTPTASNGCTSTVTYAYGFTHDYNGPYWRAEWWAQVPISKRGAQLRDTRDSERRDDFDIRQQRWTGDALPEPRSAIANSPGYPRPRWRACRTSNSRKPQQHDCPAQTRTSVSRKR